MGQLSASELATALNVSRPRVSQYVSEGKLEGCYSGSGRARKFNLAACAHALGRTLDKGQMMGNGASTRKALAEAQANATPRGEAQPETASRTVTASDDGVADMRRSDSVLEPKDPDRYELARTQKAEEEARRLRRMNAEAEGSYALVSDVTRQVAQQMAQEIGEFEAVLRDGSRQVADVLGVDFKVVRQILIDRWRDHRSTRSAQLTAQADKVALSDDERKKDT